MKVGILRIFYFRFGIFIYWRYMYGFWLIYNVFIRVVFVERNWLKLLNEVLKEEEIY